MHDPLCRTCAALHETVKIGSPSDLEAALIRAAQKVHSGCLKELTEREEPVSLDGGLSFTSPYPVYAVLSDMVERKLFGWKVLGWNDVVNLRFRCMHCGAVFSLHAETHHGSGGAWEYLEHGDS